MQESVMIWTEDAAEQFGQQIREVGKVDLDSVVAEGNRLYEEINDKLRM